MSQKANKHDLEEIKRLLRESEKEYKEEVERIENIPVIFKKMRNGIFLFVFFHFLIELIFTHYDSGNAKFVGVILFTNYFISTSIARNKANKWSVNDTTQPFYYGFLISLIVFMIRLILGFLLGFFIKY
jgi:hypothetical protein